MYQCGCRCITVACLDGALRQLDAEGRHGHDDRRTAQRAAQSRQGVEQSGQHDGLRQQLPAVVDHGALQQACERHPLHRRPTLAQPERCPGVDQVRQPEDEHQPGWPGPGAIGAARHAQSRSHGAAGQGAGPERRLHDQQHRQRDCQCRDDRPDRQAGASGALAQRRGQHGHQDGHRHGRVEGSAVVGRMGQLPDVCNQQCSV
jgi:hypothetical protein